MSTNSAGSLEFTSPGSRVHSDWLFDDESICNKLSDGLAGVGIADLIRLIGIQPSFSELGALEYPRF
jgi:hypothetical protein